ncbi:MAG: ferrous iron transport protein B, partial [Lachnospiraceae bacterium]|nr:ferrous iron transport protein B [Lachnospiraceae bacterium]
MTLAELEIGKDAVIESVVCEEISLRKHILDMGLTPGAEVTLIKTAPMGDPLEIRVRGYELTLRKEDAAHINLVSIHDAHEQPASEQNTIDINHPQTGEMGIFHVKTSGEEIPDDQMLRFGLAGNQNCGKTTLFNQLTGSNQHVGNFPGVTVDRKDGGIRGYDNTNVTDLPGIYSLSPYTSEEIVSRDFLMKDKPDGVINIVDATNIERNLYLTMQIMELNIPMVLALNMMDEMRKNGGTIHVNRLEEILGIPVVPIVAAKGEGIDELVEHALHIAKYREYPGRKDFCDENGPMAPVHRCIHAIEHLIEDHAKRLGIPVRFAATKLVESDEIILERLNLSDNEKETLEHIITEMEGEMGTDRQAALADMRFTFIERICHETVIKPHASKEYERSVKIDRILTGKYTAIPAFILIMAFIFWMTFGMFGSSCADAMEAGIDAVTALADEALSAYGINPVVHSLVIGGIFAGVGSVLSFLPTIVILFFFLSLLEDSGYMARIAFIMDKLVRKMGLSGRSFVPMLLGFGCSVPAIMSTRTLPSQRDRKLTIMLTPFMSCSAKMPIYAFFTAAFFVRQKALVMIGLYFTGIIIAVVFAKVLSVTWFKGTPVPFVMELPNYRMPGPGNVLRL